VENPRNLSPTHPSPFPIPLLALPHPPPPHALQTPFQKSHKLSGQALKGGAAGKLERKDKS
jgi:hypothetical protein